MLPILIYMEGFDGAAWVKAFKAACPDADVRVHPDWGDASEPSYGFMWKPKHGILADYPNMKVMFYGGAGVDHLVADPTLPAAMPIVRLSDEGLKNGMANWVVMSSLLHLRRMPEVMANQRQSLWKPNVPKLPQDVRVGFMGYGALGKACSEKLKIFGFAINTWSNSPKEPEGGVKHYNGQSEFKDFLGATDIVVSLLPATENTNDLLNTESLSALPKGAAVINAGRGNVIDEKALIDAINSGHLSGASLDVFKTEPLPADSPLWQCKRIILTPHISANTRIETAADYVIKAIKDYEAEGTLENLYVRDRGY